MLVASMSGWWFGGTLFLIVWVAIAFWPARVAARKGHSFFLYFLFSLVFFPAALIVAYMASGIAPSGPDSQPRFADSDQVHRWAHPDDPSSGSMAPIVAWTTV